jgi:hypothetical protein
LSVMFRAQCAPSIFVPLPSGAEITTVQNLVADADQRRRVSHRHDLRGSARRRVELLTDLERDYGTFDAPSRVRPAALAMVSAPSVHYARTPEGYGVVTGVPAQYASLPDTKAVAATSHFELHDTSILDDGADWTAEWVKTAPDEVRSIVASAIHAPRDAERSCL